MHVRPQSRKTQTMTTIWHNWSGSVTARPESIRYPATLDEIVGIVREARARGTKVRVVGAGHSFTPLVETDGVLISLERYTGLESVDHVTHQATVRAGTTILNSGADATGQSGLGVLLSGARGDKVAPRPMEAGADSTVCHTLARTPNVLRLVLGINLWATSQRLMSGCCAQLLRDTHPGQIHPV
jgi:hypothetical protein